MGGRSRTLKSDEVCCIYVVLDVLIKYPICNYISLDSVEFLGSKTTGRILEKFDRTEMIEEVRV